MHKHGKLDIMFNNAGVVGTQKGSVAEIDIQDFEQVMNVNVKGVINGIKHAARVMIPNRKGSIISTASIAGIAGGFTPYAYTASKHAVIGLTKNGAAELGKCGIRVNCISPAAIPTDLVLNYVGVNPSPEAKTKLETAIEVVAPLREANLRPEDIAEAALYLASEDSKYVSGHNMVLDGGRSVVLEETAVFGKY
ncbi:short-chain dehydrogenase reductase 2a-like [Cryptomeria japonica]|uniref:short-chain dehydrogenase reductase 2a-like n=1 Tax=Cryptomeria japonica TaxID=3369 RepID=UPI0027D9DA6F|nr:short-chain dehydrogenase reductase 2a-like [Cryptomeria japonica]XP_059065428.1 short-chain dehydrogenase reductase 2a-like [Cryptomeria japonica]